MIDKINDNLFQQLPNLAAPDSQSMGKCDKTSDSVESSVSCQKLINQAKASNTEDSQAVARARKLLQSGQLSTPENIRKAAENILKFGV